MQHFKSKFQNTLVANPLGVLLWRYSILTSPTREKRDQALSTRCIWLISNRHRRPTSQEAHYYAPNRCSFRRNSTHGEVEGVKVRKTFLSQP